MKRHISEGQIWGPHVCVSSSLKTRKTKFISDESFPSSRDES